MQLVHCSWTHSNFLTLPLKTGLVFFSHASASDGPKRKLVRADWEGHPLLPTWGFARKEALLVKATRGKELERGGLVGLMEGAGSLLGLSQECPRRPNRGVWLGLQGNAKRGQRIKSINPHRNVCKAIKSYGTQSSPSEMTVGDWQLAAWYPLASTEPRVCGWHTIGQPGL